MIPNFNVFLAYDKEKVRHNFLLEIFLCNFTSKFLIIQIDLVEIFYATELLLDNIHSFYHQTCFFLWKNHRMISLI